MTLLRGNMQGCTPVLVLGLLGGARVQQDAQAGGVAIAGSTVCGCPPVVVRQRYLRVAVQQRPQRSSAALHGSDAEHRRVTLSPAGVG